MTPQDDCELLEILGGDPELLDLARTARTREIETPIGPNFQAYLRSRLMDEAQRTLRPRGLARVFRPRLGWAAGVGATAGAVMIVAAIVVGVTQHVGPGGVSVPTAMSPVGGQSRLDPQTKAITIAFNQAMDHASVVRALHIVPATSVTTSWNGDTLTITPTHGFSASTAYVVRIDNSVARSQTGVAPKAPIVVAFGTQPTPRPSAGPSPTPSSGPPALSPTVLASTAPDADVVPGPGGRLLVTDVTPAATPAGATTGSASSTGTASGAATATITATATTTTITSTGESTTQTVTSTQTSGAATATVAPATSPPAAGPSGLVSFTPTGATPVGAGASAASVSPTGRYVAAVQPRSGGGTAIVVEGIDGSSPRTLAQADAGSPVAWTGGSLVLYVSGDHLHSVDLAGVIHYAGGTGGLAVGSGQQIVLAPGGRWAYLGPSGSSPSSSTTSTSATSAPGAAPTGGRLVDIAARTALPLPGSGAVAAFSSDGDALAWADTATPGQVDVLSLGTQPPSPVSPANVKLAPASDQISELAVAPGGVRVAGTIAGADPASVRVADVAGNVLGTVPQEAAHLAFAGAGELALVAGGQAEAVALPGTTPAVTSPPAIPDDVQALLDRLVAAQTGTGVPAGTSGGGQTTSPESLGGLPVAPGLDLSALTPRGATQGYVVSIQAVPSTKQVTAAIRLLSIPAAGSGDQVTFADETVTLDRPNGTDLVVTKVAASAQEPVPTGPHVVHVAAARSDGTLRVSVAFDSDLDPATVSKALGLGTSALPASAKTAYDADARTATLTVPLGGTALGRLAQLTLTVSTGLHDIDGNALAQPYSATVTVGG